MEVLNSGFPVSDTDFRKMADFYCDFFEKRLQDFTASCIASDADYETLSKAYSYSLEAGGKRIRPMLVFEFCRICGGCIEDALPAALAIEMIHTFSLIHDDLPCMDDDDLRRGKPSCHKAFGEAQALLAGDALTVKAFETISCSHLDGEKVKRIISVLSICAYRMIGGQIIDISGEIKDFPALKNMYLNKTSQLICASAVMGCLAAGADDELVKAARCYGENLGIAFQIIDDILDVTGDERILGKPTGSDSEQDKITSVSLLGMEEAEKAAKKFSEASLEALGCFKNNCFLEWLTNMLLGRKK